MVWIISGRPVMGRSLMTGPAEVTREQARYRRLMQLSSARSVEIGRADSGAPRDTLAPLSENSLTVKDETGEGSRRPASQQHWPRKLEPLPSRLSVDTPEPGAFAPTSRVSPAPTSPLAAATAAEGVRHGLAIEAIVKEDYGSHPTQRGRQARLRSLPSEDEDSGEENAPIARRPRSNTCPNLAEIAENGFQSKSMSPFCVSTTTVAALMPLNMKTSTNETGSSPGIPAPASPTNNAPSKIMKTMASLTTGIAAAPTMHRNAGRRPTRLSPLRLGEADAAAQERG